MKKTDNKRKITVECQEGVCPLCGGSLDYRNEEDDYNGGGTISWICENCDATGEEGYSKIFDGNHYNVKDADGNDVEIVAPELPEDVSWFDDLCVKLPKDPHVRNFWSTGEELLCYDKTYVDTVAAVLNALGHDVTVGFYNPAEDKAAGIADKLTGAYYIVPV